MPPALRTPCLLLSLLLVGACTGHDRDAAEPGNATPSPSDTAASPPGDDGCHVVDDETLRTGLSGTVARDTFGDETAYFCQATGSGAKAVWTVSPAPGATLEDLVADVQSSPEVDVRRIRLPGDVPARQSSASGPYGFASIHAIVEGAAVEVTVQASGGRPAPSVEVLTGLVQDIASAYATPGMVPTATGQP